MKNFIWLLLAVSVLQLPLSCNRLAPEEDGDNTFVPISLSTKQAGYVESGNRFAWRFIDGVADCAALEKKDSWFVSPLSLQIDLGMLLNGAKGETADEICRTLGYNAGELAEINAWSKLMLTELPKMDKKSELAMANAIFYNKTISLKKPFRNTVSDAYAATLEALDFSQGNSVNTINDWCSKQTKGMVPKVIDQISPAYLAFLINAIYFKSQWSEQFDKNATASETFVDENGKKSTVPMMKMTGKTFHVGQTEQYQSVRLPYGNGAFSMTILLPEKGHSVKDITALLAKEGLSVKETPLEVDLWLPRFETKYHIKLNDLLASMGISQAFNPFAADFSALSDTPSYVDFVQQDAAIKVNEEGSEAAAVTVIGMRKNSIGGGPDVVFHADHPFLYLITESSTGVILFAGQFGGL
ncbi:MAG: serpin family protein [Bacteroidales bacterium]|nr:serpin family protein [Bacteroidales bacterium]